MVTFCNPAVLNTSVHVVAELQHVFGGTYLHNREWIIIIIIIIILREEEAIVGESEAAHSPKLASIAS